MTIPEFPFTPPLYRIHCDDAPTGSFLMTREEARAAFHELNGFWPTAGYPNWEAEPEPPSRAGSTHMGHAELITRSAQSRGHGGVQNGAGIF